MTLGVRYLCPETSIRIPADHLTVHERYEELSIDTPISHQMISRVYKLLNG